MNNEILHDNWLPTPVKQIKTSLIFRCKDVLKSNISYNIQYLEYIMHINELERKNQNYSTTVVMKMRYKSFVIVAMGIMESIFVSLLEDKKLLPYDYEKKRKKEIQINDKEFKVSYIKQLTNKFQRLPFEEVIELISKNNILELEDNQYEVLKELKKLRNKVHLEKATNYFESDYNSFDHIIYNKTKNILYQILSNPNITIKKYNLFIEKFK